MISAFINKLWRESKGPLLRLAKEPPFRIFARTFVKCLPMAIKTKADWDAVTRPPYLVGLLKGAEQARAEGVCAIAAIEFGVAGGTGLLLLQKYAAAVSKETGVDIVVYGFDSGGGLPQFCGDYRDHPDQWRPGDYPMDEQLLRGHLSDRTCLLIGKIVDTVRSFVDHILKVPIGFIAIDLDLYSSTSDALLVLTQPGKRMLRQVPIYFDDTDLAFNHRYAGELLAIEEFNQKNQHVKIDRWRGVKNERAFPEHGWLEKIYIAHDVETISKFVVSRRSGDLPLVRTD